MKNLKVFILINLVSSCVFSLLSLSFNADLSLLAFPLAAAYTGICIWIGWFRVIKKKEAAVLSHCLRLFQYQPFVYFFAFIFQRAGKNPMPFALDVFCALAWICVLVSGCFVQYWLSDKRVYTLVPEWTEYYAQKKKAKVVPLIKGVKEVFDWIDALLQAVLIILVVNIFVLQLYQIPSESMVPTMLIKDRVAVWKIPAGPKFPLSDVGLPSVQKYKKGDIVVFSNPNYSDDRQSQLKSFFAQLLSMCTFTLVQTNTDENGEIKADPLVKRIVGEGGEQLVMLDGTLYARKNGGDFIPVKENDRWAAWDLNENRNLVKQHKIQLVPLSQEDFANTLLVESERRNLDLVSAALECRNLSRDFARYAKGSKNGSFAGFNGDGLYVLSMFRNVSEYTVTLMKENGGAAWFDSFMNSWQKGLDENALLLSQGDIYSDANFRLNVMSKLLFGRIVVESARLISTDSSPDLWKNNTVLADAYEKAQRLVMYIYLMDQRNMPVFPANDSNGNPMFIPDDCFFMMGDNRYNSLDMRHSVEQKLGPVSKLDDMSVNYYTNMNPHYVPKNKILGKARFRFWPITRASLVK